MKTVQLILEIFPSIMLASIFVMVMYFNRRDQQENHKFRLFILEDLTRLSIITNLLQTQSNPIVYEVCEQIRKTAMKDLPKSGSEFIEFYQRAVGAFLKRIWDQLQAQIDNKETPLEEKALCEERIKKLSTTMDLLSSVDKNSSPDFVKLIITEAFKTLYEG